MRDEHRPKQDLLNEVVGLRKQVADLKEAAVVRWRAEQAVRRSEEEYRALVEQAPGGICRLRADGTFEQVNSTLAGMLGYPSRTEALEFSRLAGIFDGADEHQRVVDLLSGPGEVTGVQTRLRHRDGSVIPARLSGRALRTDGDIEGFVVILTWEKPRS